MIIMNMFNAHPAQSYMVAQFLLPKETKKVPDDGGSCIIYLWIPEEPAGYHI